MDTFDFKFHDCNDIEISVRVYGRYGYAWEDKSMGHPVTQIQLKQVVPFDLALVLSGSMHQRFVRKPLDDDETGYCTYIMVDNTIDGLHREIESTVWAGMLSEMKSGPTVLDAPIVCAKTAWLCKRGPGFGYKREHSRVLSKMYDDARCNFENIRGYLDVSHPWYGKLLEEEYVGFPTAASG